MFTGIISDIGEISQVTNNGDIKVRINCNYLSTTIDLGASIACDGVCLTVVDRGLDEKNWFEVEVSAETVSKTNISSPQNKWEIGRKLNLERALKVGDELGGHIVSGHVDGIATIKNITIEGDSTRISFTTSSELAKFIAKTQNKELKFDMVDFHSQRPGHDLRYSLDGAKMSKMGWNPKSVYKQLESTIEWTLKNDRWLSI